MVIEDKSITYIKGSTGAGRTATITIPERWAMDYYCTYPSTAAYDDKVGFTANVLPGQAGGRQYVTFTSVKGGGTCAVFMILRGAKSPTGQR